MKRIYLNKEKLKNNHDYEDLINEINSYKDFNYIPEDRKIWEYRKKLFDGATTIDKGNIKAVVIPNNTFRPYINNNGKKQKFGVACNDYTIHFFYKGVKIGTYSKYFNKLNFDIKLKDSNIIAHNMNTILDIIPFDKFNIKYETYFVDWNNRPFYS